MGPTKLLNMGPPYHDAPKFKVIDVHLKKLVREKNIKLNCYQIIIGSSTFLFFLLKNYRKFAPPYRWLCRGDELGSRVSILGCV